MSDPALWRRVHSDLLPLLRRQLLLSLGALPLAAALILVPEAFPLLLLGYIALVLGAVAWAVRATFRSINSNG